MSHKEKYYETILEQYKKAAGDEQDAAKDHLN